MSHRKHVRRAALAGTFSALILACGSTNTDLRDIATDDASAPTLPTLDASTADTNPSAPVTNDGAVACTAGPENTAEACSDGCSNDNDRWADCDDFDCCDVRACPATTACGRRSADAGDAGVDPNAAELTELANPARLSAPFECQGSAITAAEFATFIGPGRQRLFLENGKDFAGTGNAFVTRNIYRRCTAPLTCGDWGSNSSTIGDYQLAFETSPEEPLVLAHYGQYANLDSLMDRHPTTVADLPIKLSGRWFRLRMTRRANGNLCASMVSTVSRAPGRNGETIEIFELAIASSIAPPP